MNVEANQVQVDPDMVRYINPTMGWQKRCYTLVKDSVRYCELYDGVEEAAIEEVSDKIYEFTMQQLELLVRQNID